MIKKKAKKKKNICQKTLDKLINFCKKLFECLRLLSDSFKSCFNKIICNNYCCQKKCCCCCCLECLDCNKIQEEDYNLNEGYFCYCYKSKRHMKWFNMFITDATQVKIMPLLLQYFVIQLNTVAFEKIFDENNEEGYNDLDDSKSIWGFVGIFGVSLFLFFYITISFANFVSFMSGEEENDGQDKKEGDNVEIKIEEKKEENKIEGNDGEIEIENKKDENKKKVFKDVSKLGKSAEKLSNEILNGTYGVLIFHGFYSFVLSICCLYNDITNNNYFYIPILINKFYFFTFAHQCTINTENDDEINYFTVATLLSIYLQIWDLFIEQVKRIPTSALLYIQIFISTGIIVFALYIFVLLLFFIKKFLFTLLYILSTFCSFGGFWFVPCYKKCELKDKECNMLYGKKCLCFDKENLENIKKKFFGEED